MWFQHPALGHFSLVVARAAGGTGPLDQCVLQVRARRREHVEALQSRCPSLASCHRIDTTSSDYPTRIIAPRQAVADALHALVMSHLAYANVKDEAGRVWGMTSRWHHALAEAWSVFRALEDPRPSRAWWERPASDHDQPSDL